MGRPDTRSPRAGSRDPRDQVLAAPRSARASSTAKNGLPCASSQARAATNRETVGSEVRTICRRCRVRSGSSPRTSVERSTSPSGAPSVSGLQVRAVARSSTGASARRSSANRTTLRVNGSNHGRSSTASTTGPSRDRRRRWSSTARERSSRGSASSSHGGASWSSGPERSRSRRPCGRVLLVVLRRTGHQHPRPALAAALRPVPPQRGLPDARLADQHQRPGTGPQARPRPAARASSRRRSVSRPTTAGVRTPCSTPASAPSRGATRSDAGARAPGLPTTCPRRSQGAPAIHRRSRAPGRYGFVTGSRPVEGAGTGTSVDTGPSEP